jgi:signal transduction histidine kinase/ActR/RegA family two-component response regulator
MGSRRKNPDPVTRKIRSQQKRIADLKARNLALNLPEEDYLQDEVLLSAVMDNSPVIMIVMDADRRVRKANRAALGFTERSGQDLEGRRVGEALRCVHSLNDPKGCGFGISCEKCVMHGSILRTFETGRALTNVEGVLAFMSGEATNELFYIISTAPVMLSGEKMVIVFIQDITERKRSEIELRKAYNELETKVSERTAELTKAYQALRRDMIERKRREEEKLALERTVLEAQRQESLQVLAGGIAHDFNNLLMSVLGCADLALADLHSESPSVSHVRNIKEAGARLAELSHQMLVYSGRGRFVAERMNLSRLIQEMAPFLRVLITGSAVMKTELMEDLPAIRADAVQIRQIVLNLVMNAIEAIGKKKGIVWVRTDVVWADRVRPTEVPGCKKAERGQEVYLEVSDTGRGMERDILQKIFDPFFSTKFTGRGLGLAAVKGIVDGHKGKIQVQSEPGQGSTFRISFPSVGPPNGPLEIEQRNVRQGHKGGTILVVDDQEAVRSVAVGMLKKSGYEVLSAEGGRAALRLLAEDSQRISAVLLDLTMPDMDGMETFQEIRRMRPELPIILSSGYSMQDATGRFAGKGLAGFIQKPYDMKSLIEKLQRILSK